MNIQALDNKIELIQWLSSIEDSIIIEKLMKFRKEESSDWWNEISVEEKESIEKGIRDADNGKLKPHSTARKIYEKWL
ncbi:MAG: hypothetical protein RO257_04835 [Candidatus Kapabacteria bacterium]|jgi:hypothetical protein|nr:hypothetical protein [Candidatus Kapabacteria bacterium]